MGCRGPYPELERRGRGVDPPTTSSAEAKERVYLYLFTLCLSLQVIIGYGVIILHNIVHLAVPSLLNSHIFLNIMF